jgi:hypothetical protein
MCRGEPSPVCLVDAAPAIYTEVQQRLAHREALLDMRQQADTLWVHQLYALTQQPRVVPSVHGWRC